MIFVTLIIQGETGYTHSLSPSRPPNSTLNPFYLTLTLTLTPTRRDFPQCQLLIVLGTSLAVHPFAGLDR